MVSEMSNPKASYEFDFSENTDPKPKDTLYKEYINHTDKDHSTAKLHTIESQINNMLHSYKADTESRRASAKRLGKDCEVQRSHKSGGNRTLCCKSEEQAASKKEAERLKGENLELLQRLSRKKAKIAVQKEELKKLRQNGLVGRQESDLSRSEVASLQSEIAKKNKEISELHIENKVLRNERLKFNKWKKKMHDIIKLGAEEYDYLKKIEYQKYTNEDLCEQITRLVEYLVEEKKVIEEKYTKLLELHSSLVEENGNYSAEYIYRVIDENDTMKRDLELMCSKKLYLSS
eukprot:TRINITY_DN15847_c0_g1_i2.p1 TRINITY_DN15847_c0_g1~~TRINITY_DN15847_c0_g1_i2.p1  ORF type:complete len:290 (-),score=81.14 TRINITY_DN15847_c0_g1_i2:365-1234(-)